MDWQNIGERVAPVLALAFGMGGVLCILAAWRLRRTAQAASFSFVREQSLLQAQRLSILALGLLAASAVSEALWGIATRNPSMLPTPAPTPTLTPIPTPTPRPPTPTFTVTPTPTITPTSTPISLSSRSLPAILRTPFPNQAAPPGPNATLLELVLAAGEKDNRPVGPTSRFPRGTERVYAFFTFDGMARNVPWAHVWYRRQDGELVEVWGKVELWPYDVPRGYGWRYFNCTPGQYELHVYIGRKLQRKVLFTVEGGN